MTQAQAGSGTITMTSISASGAVSVALGDWNRKRQCNADRNQKFWGIQPDWRSVL